MLDVQVIRRPQRPVEEIRQIMEVTAWWEELILLPDEHIPLVVFDDNTSLKLRRLWFNPGSVSVVPKFGYFLLNVLPAYANMVDLKGASNRG